MQLILGLQVLTVGFQALLSPLPESRRTQIRSTAMTRDTCRAFWPCQRQSLKPNVRKVAYEMTEPPHF